MADEINANGNGGKKEKRVLLQVNNLKKYFPVRAGLLQRVQAHVKAVDDISFFIYEGESFGLVGESGCGKTTVGRTLLRLLPATSGDVIFDGKEWDENGNGETRRHYPSPCVGESTIRTPTNPLAPSPRTVTS